MSKVLCIGAVTVDKVSEVDSEVNKIIDKPGIYFIGGRAVTVSLDLNFLKINSSLVGAVGQNFKNYQSVFLNKGINISNVVECDGVCDEVFAYIVKKTRKTNVFFRSNGLSFGELSDSCKRLISSSNVVYLSCWDINYSIEVIDYIEKNRLCLVQNFAYEVCFDKLFISRALSVCKIALMNEKEYQILVEQGYGEVTDWFKRYPQLGWVIVTYGDKGSCGWYRNGKKIKQIKMAAVKVKRVHNSMGAGDAYSSGIIKGYLNNWSLKRSVKLGSEMGARAVISESGYVE